MIMGMQIDNFSLKNFNTFGINALTRHYFSFTSNDELLEFLEKSCNYSIPIFILGGGSNILFTKNFEGTIIHPQNKGITIIDKTNSEVFVKVAAGEIWDDFVAWAVSNQLHGIENLSLIPGNIGASPVQNIGAYGVEACETICEVHTIETLTGKSRTFSLQECDFGYRSSIFKTIEANKYIVLDVIFRLQKHGTFRLEYGSIKNEIESHGKITLETIRETIISIRNEKLPDPKQIGNAGSFFKNPIVSISHYNELYKKFPNIVSYPISNSEIKIAAGWLIDTLGFKGYTIGNAKVHEKQALVLTNTGNASGKEIVLLSKKIQEKVFQETGIHIEPEVIFL